VIAIIRGIKTLPTLNENCWDPRIAVTSHLSCTGQRVGMDGIAIQQQLEWNPGWWDGTWQDNSDHCTHYTSDGEEASQRTISHHRSTVVSIIPCSRFLSLSHCVSLFWFLRATAAIAVAHLSHRNSVCPSITQVDQSKTVQARITISSPSDAWKTLVSGTIKFFHKFERGHPKQKR